MDRRAPLQRFLRSEDGSMAVEFSIVGILFLIIVLAVIDMSRLAWELNSAKAAARAGARLAVVSSPVATQLANYDAVALGVPGGQPVLEGSAAAPPDYVCTSTGCSNGGTLDTTTFNRIVARMQGYYGRLTAANVVIEYRHRGLGLAGFIGPDVEPLVTVRVQNLSFQSASLQIFGVTGLTVPSVTTTLTGESLGATSASI